jgi:serine/threonine protein kinase
MEPTKFGRYEIKGEIGRGGMATVYHAYDPRFEREVAIKVLPREMLHDPQFRTRFEREAKTVAMLEHPAIVPVYDFGEEEGQPYFVMRYMTGGSLSDRMKKGPMTVKDAAHLLTHLGPALDEAHAKGIIHRDLKPGNILYDQYNEPYVSDFGIAKLSEAQTNVTGSAIVGTPAYMSPEQAQGEGVDGRSDIYGLGVILFEMLTGQQPYHGDTPMSVVVKHITDPVPHILDVKPDLPGDIEAVIEKAMAKDRNERFQTVKALAEALNAVARGEKPDLGPADVTVVSQPKTVATKRPVQSLQETVLSKRAAQTQVAPAKKGGGAGIVVGLIALVLIVAAIAGVFIFKDKLPFLAAPAATQTTSSAQGQQTPGVKTNFAGSVTNTTAAISQPAASDTPAPTPTDTVAAPAGIGGADLIAFVSDNNIWTVGTDGKDPKQITKDNTEKHGLQWSPDGQSLFYISGKCIHYITIADEKDTTLNCYTAADYLDAFEISPDGKQVAISLNRVLYVVPFDLQKLAAVRNWTQLRDMKGCFTYGDLHGQPAPKSIRWSGDGKVLAANSLTMSPTGRVDSILVFDISKCDNTVSSWLDNFPSGRFVMTGYNKNPAIPYFDWDGQSLFLLNSIFRFNFGYLYAYNYETKKPADLLSPLKSCCYASESWSPDGSYILFAYQDVDGGATQLYYIPFGTIGTGATYQPLTLPDGLFKVSGDRIEIALRPVK